MTTYAERWGKPRQRRLAGDPRREARRLRAQERATVHVCTPTCKRFRTGRLPFPVSR